MKGTKKLVCSLISIGLLVPESNGQWKQSYLHIIRDEYSILRGRGEGGALIKCGAGGGGI